MLCMQPAKPIFKTLPLFRKDLKLHRGPDEADGSPTYNLQDPIRGQYYKINWKESLIFKCLKPDMSSKQLADEINAISTLKVQSEDIERFFLQCAQLDLLRIPKGSEYYTLKDERQQSSAWYWLLTHYLYLRIPILNPDKFLKRTLHYVQFFGSTWAIAIYAILTFWGLYLMLGRLDQFLNTFTYFFNLQGLIIYGIAISTVKIVHEFSHAYVAKRYGIHVPTMGIALIVLWPVLYTDVTDSWKLAKRSQRLAISFAGIAAETIVAGLSTLGWVLSNPGMLQSVFFVLATTSWFSTVLINSNPAVRFDGYYITCDLMGIDNLQFRAFNVLRWKYLQWLFGVETPSPEEGLKPSIITGMAIYAIYTYIYRIILYTGIAIFVYYEFTKALGILLFVAEVLIFMVWPVFSEGQQIYMARKYFHLNARSLITYSILGLALAWFILPLPHEESFSAIIEPIQEQVLYVPADSVVQKVYAHRDEKVKPGQPILDLASKSLLKDLGNALLQKEQLENEITALSINAQDADYIAGKKNELAKASDYYEELQRKRQLLNIKANMAGELFDWNEDLKQGQSLAAGTILGKIATPQESYAMAFVPETEINNFSVGQEAKIVIQHPLNYLYGKVERINPARAETLAYANMASPFRGPLPVTTDETGKRLVLVESYYIVYIKINPADAKDLRYGQIAEVRIHGPWQSKFMQLIRYAQRIFLRESSL